jgi:hypothetical protein
MWRERCREICSGRIEGVSSLDSCEIHNAEKVRAHPFEVVGYEVFKIEDF